MIKMFLLGVLSFSTSQIFLRIPILNYLYGNFEFGILAIKYGLLINIIIIFTSGLFEETGRFLIRNYLIRDDEIKSIKEPIIFGLGHGLCEAVYLIAPLIGSYSFQTLVPAYSERILAIVLHIGLSVILFKGFELGKKYLYTVIAIFLHSGLNSLILFIGYFNLGVEIIYIPLLIIDIAMIFYILKSKNAFRRKK